MRERLLPCAAMVKCEDLSGAARPFIRAVGPNDSALRLDERTEKAASGTNDWKSISTYLNVPQDSLGVCVEGDRKSCFQSR